MTPAQKFERRWKRRQRINPYPLGYETSLTKLHDGINFRASIAANLSDTRDLLWRLTAFTAGADYDFVCNAPLIALYYRFFNTGGYPRAEGLTITLKLTK